MRMVDEWNKKKDFNVEWKDTKGKIHNTKILKRCISAKDALEYIKDACITYCSGRAWRI